VIRRPLDALLEDLADPLIVSAADISFIQAAVIQETLVAVPLGGLGEHSAKLARTLEEIFAYPQVGIADVLD